MNSKKILKSNVEYVTEEGLNMSQIQVVEFLLLREVLMQVRLKVTLMIKEPLEKIMVK
ncbi:MULTISPECIES: hypothetical protein [Clostridium]|uniref:hypothetical protein n=1 Tax=Clostridium TaxID=1485 RepID=UPI00232B1241|nr:MULTISPECIES: hypothetical protein [Clostridium]MDU1280440.1 hypothetical protein [Clostridium sp.]